MLKIYKHWITTKTNNKTKDNPEQNTMETINKPTPPDTQMIREGEDPNNHPHPTVDEYITMARKMGLRLTVVGIGEPIRSPQIGEILLDARLDNDEIIEVLYREMNRYNMTHSWITKVMNSKGSMRDFD
jgi:hypothetical protein